jgi:hypothetical protein
MSPVPRTISCGAGVGKKGFWGRARGFAIENWVAWEVRGAPLTGILG